MEGNYFSNRRNRFWKLQISVSATFRCRGYRGRLSDIILGAEVGAAPSRPGAKAVRPPPMFSVTRYRRTPYLLPRGSPTRRTGRAHAESHALGRLAGRFCKRLKKLFASAI